MQIVSSNYKCYIRNDDGFFINHYDTYQQALNALEQLQKYSIVYNGEYCVYFEDGNYMDTLETQRQAYDFILDMIGILKYLENI